MVTAEALIAQQNPSSEPETIFSSGTRSRIEVAGPLAPYARGFRTALTEQGFTRWIVAQHTHLMAHVSRWLVEQRLTADRLAEERVVGAFVSIRRAEGHDLHVSRRGMAPLLKYLRDVGVVPAAVMAPPAGLVEELLVDYRTYLGAERGLAPLSIDRYLRTARLFTAGLPVPVDAATLAELSAGQVTDFLVAEVARLGVWGAKARVTALRALLRYLHVVGHIPRPLIAAVPSVAGWGLGSLPRAVTAEHVAALLASCDRSTAMGLRDYAIVLMLWRLGLRIGEVAHLRLDDIDWERGELLVRGKGGRQEKLPLPVDVGQTLVDYLTRGRPRWGACRCLFVIHRAPYTGLSRSSVVSVVFAACHRAGVDRISPHRLRHTAASDLLARGAPLVEVGQVLRHQAQSTTAIYAKLDFHALGELVRPWPGAS
ncbi:tyrosine-type recombinase/integrase [Nonomuraea sp. NPDC059023]|uniref:tyrosine-type recombinase/integrase n=1 Tax=unclassified Nonomuraea TaxID=2593643 RepID=UPI0036A0D18D